MSDIKDHVINERGYTLMGDSRGVTVSWTLRQEVYEWATQNKIIIEYQGSLSGQDLWYIKDDDHRAWFVLKWR